eukprot:7979039-Alexandrium_andersonii.AAC.1
MGAADQGDLRGRGGLDRRDAEGEHPLQRGHRALRPAAGGQGPPGAARRAQARGAQPPSG